ncbi:MAG: hypothetical protein ACXVRH_15920 [Thermoleophilaceae bacterium]
MAKTKNKNAKQQQEKSGNIAAKAAIGVVATAAAVGGATWAAIKRTRRPKVLGVTVPAGLKKATKRFS